MNRKCYNVAVAERKKVCRDRRFSLTREKANPLKRACLFRRKKFWWLAASGLCGGLNQEITELMIGCAITLMQTSVMPTMA